MTASEMLKQRNIPDFYVDYGDNFADFKKQAGDILLSEEYGFFPDYDYSIEAKSIERDKRFCAGKAVLEKLELTVHFAHGSFSFPIYSVIPKSEKKLPFFIHINFRDAVPDKYMPSEEIADNGFAVLSFCYNDVTRDNDDFTDGICKLLFPSGERECDCQCGKIAIWSWAASRVLDYALTLPILDGERATVIGHSRLGKTALFTGAFDSRFYCAVSNDSGCCGAALHRGKLKQAEHISDICKSLHYWFCRKLLQYVGREEVLPYDQHLLIAMNMPHYVYIASAENDLWADPTSEFLSCVAAAEICERAGYHGAFPNDNDVLPSVGSPLHDGLIGYHVRRGDHYLSRTDWNYVMDFLKSKDRKN